jgi:hypothetical protein
VAGLLLVGVSACATAERAQQESTAFSPAPGAAEQQPAEAALKAAIEALKASEAAGHTVTIRGFGHLELLPAPTLLLEKRSVSLIPSTPDLEAQLLTIHLKWREGRRRPLSLAELQAAFALLDRHVRAVRSLGGDALIRVAETDEKGTFTLEDVPAGRWLLVTTLESPVSALLWAIPADIGKTGTVQQVYVNNGTILLEGRAAPREEPLPR